MTKPTTKPTIDTEIESGPKPRVGSSATRGGAVATVAVIVALSLAAILLVNRHKTSNAKSATTGGSAAGQYRFDVGEPGPGKAALPIVLPSTDGTSFDLSTYKGRGVLLYFQEGIGCQPCWDQMKDFAKASAEFKAVGVDEFVTITSNPVNLLVRKMRQDGVGGIVLADTDLAVSKTYHANDYGMMGKSTDGHSFVFVDPAGTIRWRADYGGSPDFTMYVPPANLLADLRVGLGLPATA